MIKLAVGITTAGSLKTQTAFALYRLLKQPSYECEFLFKEGCLIHLNREILAEQAIKAGCSHLLFVDSDMYFEKDAAQKLLERDKDIIGVHYNLRKFPLTTTVKIEAEKKKNIAKLAPDGLTTCNSLGTGFLLIKIAVFKMLQKPWFDFSRKDGEVFGEDYYFCEKAREAGYELWVDLSIPVKHIGDYLY